MKWIAALPYVAALVAQQLRSMSSMLGFVTSACLMWLVLVILIEDRSTVPTLRKRQDGWSRPLSENDVESASAILRLGFLASWMRTALAMFGGLLLCWTLLP